MSFDAKTFGQNLKKSSLSPEVQESLLTILPTLKMEQINEIDQILKQDIKQQGNIFKKAQLKIDILIQECKKSS
jgi:hypothetical protein